MSASLLFLETFIVPVCRFELLKGAAHIRAFHGTAFFIDDKGTFMTARHVVENGLHDVAEKGGVLGLCVRPPGSSGNVVNPLGVVNYAPDLYDVSVGTVDGHYPTTLTLATEAVHAWKDVATFGYPETALNVLPEAFWIYGRAFRGYVHREVKQGQFPGNSHPDSFEVSFPIPPGLSGAPLFLHKSPRDVVVGLCVGVNRGETTEFVFEEIRDDGQVRTEKRVRIEEYGIAHDLRPLHGWRPPSFNGLSLLEIARQGLTPLSSA